MDIKNKTEAIVELQSRLRYLNSDQEVLEEIKGRKEAYNLTALSGQTVKNNAEVLIKSITEEQEAIHAEIKSIIDEKEPEADNAYES